MAPEVGLGLRTTVRLEVYSPGSSLYQLLTGDWLNPAINPLPGCQVPQRFACEPVLTNAFSRTLTRAGTTTDADRESI
jgi:hypothetical protein